MNSTRIHQLGMNKGGFTLIETVVSITILAIAIVGPITLAGRSIRVAREARQELTATYLAQEGIEIIHNIRDNSSADDDTGGRAEWLDLNGGGTLHSVCLSGCVVDATFNGGGSDVWNEANVVCSTASADRRKVYYDASSGFYRQRCGALSGYIDSGFSRWITLSTVSARQEHVVSRVTYKTAGGMTRTIVVEDDLYNWFPDLDPPPP